MDVQKSHDSEALEHTTLLANNLTYQFLDAYRIASHLAQESVVTYESL